jgi:hypothetical protein
LVNPPGNARDFYGVAFCTHRDLVGMEVMQAQFVEQRLFNNLMQIVRFEDFFSTFKPLSNSCARGTGGNKDICGIFNTCSEVRNYEGAPAGFAELPLSRWNRKFRLSVEKTLRPRRVILRISTLKNLSFCRSCSLCPLSHASGATELRVCNRQSAE